MRRIPSWFWLLAIILFTGTASTSRAGVVLTAKDGSKTYISRGKMKEVPARDPNVVILDSRNETITMINMRNRVYASGKVEELCRAVKNTVQNMMESIPPEQKKMMEQYMSMMGKKEASRPKSVKVAKSGKGRKIAGYPTVRFTVEVDGRLYAEHFVTSSSDILGEFGNFRKFSKVASKLDACLSEGMAEAPFPVPETSPEYRKIYEAGYSMLVINYSEGTPRVEEEVVKVRKLSISDSEFLPPKGFRKVSFDELIAGGM